MIELLTSMWGYLAGAGVIGLILGWAVRGVFLPRPKTVSVASQVQTSAVLTSEHQAKLNQVERLEAELKASQERLVTMEDVITQLRSEAESANNADTAPVALTSEDTQAEAPKITEPDPKSAQEVWRQRYLESRVRFLEKRLSEQSDFATVETPEPVTDEGISLEEWMARYKTARISKLEAELAAREPSETELPEAAVTSTASALHAGISLEEWMSRYTAARISFLEANTSSSENATALEAEIAARDSEIVDLKSTLARLSDEIESAQQAKSEVSTLKQTISDLEAEKADPEAEASDDESTPDLSSDDAAKLARLTWQNRYLKARVNHLENIPAPAEDADAVELINVSARQEERNQALESEVSKLRTELSKATEGSSDAEQELARLRWRNRYLEGRLKYLEAAALDAASDADDSVLGSFRSEPPAAQPAPPPQPENIAAFITQELERVAAEDETRPASLDAPNGAPDDLKRIGGIGPKIEGILNELGIFHFSQIAEWNPQEEAWIDSYLRIQGRVMRERWVDQANELSQVGTN
ncbi:MAG: hypothetical protein CMK07_04110 [Ponticaulis sp.]|nr:hypothetical protein [Ponticaulis sp.]